MNWFRKWLRRQASVALGPLPSPAIWNAEDVTELRKFFNSSTGNRFTNLCRAKVLDDAISGCHSNAHDASKAAGADELLRWQFNKASDKELQEISRATSVKVAPTAYSGSQTAPELAERRAF